MNREVMVSERQPDGTQLCCGAGWLSRLAALSCVCSLAVASLFSAPAPDDPSNGRAFSYVNDKVVEGPWSVHLVKLDRASTEYELHTMLGNGQITGMTTLTDQVKALPAGLGLPIAAVNGDFYFTSPRVYNGDPQGIQILDGELVSAPTEHACFWIDAAGQPRTGIVKSLFHVIWPDGNTQPVGLNEKRAGDAAVLYTPRMGPSTGTPSGGREIILEAEDKDAWLPLRVGAKVRARVKEIREAGDTPLQPRLMVFSLGPKLLGDIPTVAPGDVVQISTATLPDMAGCRTAIGGGPRLVVDGKPVEGWSSPNVRHPRTALGWNDSHIYLMLVDGRQPGLSVGMGFQEMANYFIKRGCTHAINLDGGGSASMWVLGQTVSSPSEGKERPIANGLVVIKKPKKETP